MLVLDAATTTIQAGLLGRNGWISFNRQEGEALETVFTAVEKVLGEAGMGLADLKAAALGVGPGSILGLRLAKMAMDTWACLPDWRTLRRFAFRGMEAIAARHAQAHPQLSFRAFSDFRKGSWHAIDGAGGVVGELRVLSDADLVAGELPLLYLPTGRGTPPAADIPRAQLAYDLRPLESASSVWYQPVEGFELYLPSPPVFKKWDARPHGAN